LLILQFEWDGDVTKDCLLTQAQEAINSDQLIINTGQLTSAIPHFWDLDTDLSCVPLTVLVLVM